MIHLDILPPAQRAMLPDLAALRQLGFVLYGGTAIALQLAHRVSIDFDFFNDSQVTRDALVSALPFLGNARTLQEEPDTWTVLSGLGEDVVKLSFFTGLGFGRIGEPVQTDDRLQLASLDDLLGHKLKVLLQRVEAKDYRDIAAMLHAGQRLEDGLGAAVALFPNLPPCEAVRALVHFEGNDLADLTPPERDILVAHVQRMGPPSVIGRRSERLSA